MPSFDRSACAATAWTSGRTAAPAASSARTATPPRYCTLLRPRDQRAEETARSYESRSSRLQHDRSCPFAMGTTLADCSELRLERARELVDMCWQAITGGHRLECV